MAEKRYLRAFTLLEVLISAVLVLMGIGVVSLAIVAGSNFLKRVDKRQRAMAVASQKMQEYLMKSYSTLENLQINSGIQSGSDSTGQFQWQVTINSGAETGSIITIPYKTITANVFYNNASLTTASTYDETVSLENIAAYPQVHTKSMDLTASLTASTDTADLPTLQDLPGLQLDFDYAVPKDIMIGYDIAVNVTTDTTAGPNPGDLLVTQCYIKSGGSGTTPIGPQGAIPVATQFSVDNIAASTAAVVPGSYTAFVRWISNPDVASARTVSLRRASMTIVAVDHQ